MKRYDPFTKFARTHLATPAERAVYLTLVGTPADSWSAAEIASRNRLEYREAQRVLESFEAAGVVEAVDRAGDGPRYRWRADVRYLLDGWSQSTGWLDPVCSMPVSAQSPYEAKDANGEWRRFCSSLCLAAFRAFPAAFTRPPTGSRRDVPDRLAG